MPIFKMVWCIFDEFLTYWGTSPSLNRSLTAASMLCVMGSVNNENHSQWLALDATSFPKYFVWAMKRHHSDPDFHATSCLFPVRHWNYSLSLINLSHAYSVSLNPKEQFTSHQHYLQASQHQPCLINDVLGTGSLKWWDQTQAISGYSGIKCFSVDHGMPDSCLQTSRCLAST